MLEKKLLLLHCQKSAILQTILSFSLTLRAFELCPSKAAGELDRRAGKGFLSLEPNWAKPYCFFPSQALQGKEMEGGV